MSFLKNVVRAVAESRCEACGGHGEVLSKFDSGYSKEHGGDLVEALICYPCCRTNFSELCPRIRANRAAKSTPKPGDTIPAPAPEEPKPAPVDHYAAFCEAVKEHVEPNLPPGWRVVTDRVYDGHAGYVLDARGKEQWKFWRKPGASSDKSWADVCAEILVTYLRQQQRAAGGK